MTLIGIQARTNSSRLPGKIKMEIGGKPMLQHVIERAKQIPVLFMPKQVAVLTTPLVDDDWIVGLCRELQIGFYRGQPGDVLGRYAEAAKLLDLGGRDPIMRLTGDCPLLDPEVSAGVLHRFLHSSTADYVSNLRDWPEGLDTEVFSASVLYAADRQVTSREDREHVTPWMRRNATQEGLLPVLSPYREIRQAIKWSVDTQEDLALVREIYNTTGGSRRWKDALAAMITPLCPHCQAKVPHVEQRGRVIWELHAPEVPGGRGRVECLNPRIARWRDESERRKVYGAAGT